VGVVGEPWLVVRLQQETDHFANEFVRPGRQAQWTFSSVLLRDVGPSGWLEPVAFAAHRVDDASDPRHGHAVRGFSVGPGCHRPLVGVDVPVGHQVQAGVEQLPVQFIARQASPTAFTEDTQHRFGVLQFRIPPGCVNVRSPGPLRPVDGLPVLLGRALLRRLLRGLCHHRTRVP